MSKAARNSRSAGNSGLWARMLAVLTLTLTLVLAPGIAQAAFVSAAPAQLAASTLTLAAPPAGWVSATCTKKGRYYVLSVTVDADASRATGFEISVTGLDGGTNKTVVGASGGTGSYVTVLPGKWNYKVSTLYQVPGAPSNVWRSATALSGNPTC